MAQQSSTKRKKKRTKKSSEETTELQKYYTFGLFGHSGVGKTSLSATAPKPVFLDSNQGLLAIQGKPGLEHVRGYPVHNIRQFERYYDYLTGTGKRDWSKRFRTVIFDHFDDIQAIVLDELNARVVERDSRRERDLTGQQEWGIMGNRLKRFLRQYKSLPMHKVLTFGVSEDRNTGQLVPSLQGQLRSSIGYFCDFMIYIRIGKGGKRYIHFTPTDRYYAKARPWWWTIDKMKVEPDDTEFLTKLFQQIAAAGREHSNTANE